MPVAEENVKPLDQVQALDGAKGPVAFSIAFSATRELLACQEEPSLALYSP